jgi:hypothetical protein
MIEYYKLIEEAVTLRKNKQLADALGNLILLTIRHPNEMVAYLEAGKTALEMGDKEFALFLFKRANKANEHNFWPYFFIVEMKNAEHDFVAAFEWLQKAAQFCKSKVSDEEYGNILKLFCDVRSNIVESTGGASIENLQGPPIPGRALKNALRVSLVKDEEDIIYASLKSSYMNGIRYFSIADNGSKDSTWQEICRFRDDHSDCIVYLISDPVVGHFQAVKTMSLARFAVSVMHALGTEIEWVFPLDADEMIHLSSHQTDLFSLLHEPIFNEKKMMVYRMHNFSSGDIIDRLPPGADIESIFPLYSPKRFNRVKKAAFKVSPEALIEEGNHFCGGAATDPSEIIIAEEHGIVLKHYPIRSVEQFRKKIINGGSAYETVPNSERLGVHWRRNYEQYMAEGDEFIIKKISLHNRECR